MKARYIVTHVVGSLAVLILASLLTFFMVHSMPGGPEILMNQDLTAGQAEQLKTELGLNRPLYRQYVDWMNELLHGNLGLSLNSGRTVTSLVFARLPNSILLGLTALGIALLISIPLGVWAAVRENSVIDHLISILTFGGVSLPFFWFGLMMIMVFSVYLHWLPSGGRATADAQSLGDTLRHLIMPALVLSIGSIAELTRYTRSAMLEVLRQDYLRTARSKGLPNRKVLVDHALRNGLLTVSSIAGLQVARVAGGAAVIETVFAWPGMGQLLVSSALGKDYPVVMGITVVVTIMVVLANLIVDLLYPIMDPRIRLS